MEIYVKEYGAYGDGIQNDTVCVQKAIDDCSKLGGGEVVLTSGIYLVGTIQLKNNVILNLHKDAVIAGSSQIEDYPDLEGSFTDAVGHKRGRTLIYGYHVKNIGIKGEGLIHGRGEHFPTEGKNHLIRPFLVRMIGCENVAFHGITCKDSAAWGIHLLESNDILIKTIKIISRCNENNDGIDIDSCTKVRMEDCYIDSGDDGICLKATSNQPCSDIIVKNCTVTSRWAGFKIGTESVGDFNNIEVDHCRFFDVKGGGIKIVPVDGGSVKNLKISNITMLNCTGPIFVSTGERLRQYFNTKKKVPGKIEDVIIENITADVVFAPTTEYEGKPWGNALGNVVCSGLQEENIKNLTIRNCHFVMPGGMKEYKKEPVPEMGILYPEFHRFDPLPTYGIYLRYCDGIVLSNITLDKKQADVRTGFVQENCKNIKSERIVCHGE